MEMILLSCFLLCSCFVFLILGYNCFELHKMRQQQKTLNQKDIISELPHEILSQVISLLPLKEAVRTSVLSKSWILKWTAHMYIVCDVSLLGLSPDEAKSVELIGRGEKHKFIKLVDHIMQKRCNGTKMNSFLIRFPLSRKEESHITSWISNAVMMGVETINLDLSGACTNIILESSRGRGGITDWKYTFPFSVQTVLGKACVVKHLRLASCGLRSLSPLNSLASLISVELRSVIFSSEQLDEILCSCWFLERLILNCCPHLVNFKLTRRKSRLRILSFKLCDRLKTVELDADNLEIFEYTAMYSCYIDGFSFNHVPKLTGLYLWFCGTHKCLVDKAIGALFRITNDMPALQTLNIWFFSTTMLPEEVPKFTRIVHLVLAVRPLDGNDKLECISYILKAFPLLRKLQLNQYISSPQKLIEVDIPQVVHENLRELEINGYHGSQREVDLLKYLVNSAVKLEFLVISPRVKVYEGFSDWYYQEVSCNKLSSEKIKELHSLVPKAVTVKYCNL